MLDNIKAVIFDLDGSLVDSMWLWKDIDIEYLSKFGIDMPADLQSKIEGMSFNETAIYFKEHFDIPDTIDEMKREWNRMAWNKYLCEVPLKPGVPEFLDYCKENGIILGIATSNSRELVENISNVHNLGEYFQCIMTSAEVSRGKPAPDIYLAVSGEIGIEPKYCLVFEDIIPGIMAAKNAGMKVCAVEDEYSLDVTDQKKAQADFYLSDFRELMRELNE
ncbi:MAG: HAD family phosphatase [Acetatifactor sp.]|nr:HAD family phosphatase [Acetatifactor sp.]